MNEQTESKMIQVIKRGSILIIIQILNRTPIGWKYKLKSQSIKPMRQENYEAQQMTGALCTAIRRFINEEQKQAMHKFSTKNHSSQVNAKQKKIQEQQHNEFKTQSLYDELVNVLDKLKKIMKRMNTINKIKKAKLNIFNSRLMDFIQELSNLIEIKVFNIKVDKFVIALVEQTNKALTECDRILTSLEKQSTAFCCGRNEETKYTFYRSLINVIGYGPVWSFIPKFSPVVQEKIQRIQTLIPLRYDFQQLEKLIEKQVLKFWPQNTEKQVEIVRQVNCNKPHVESQVIESKQSVVSSISSESEEPEIKNLNQQAPNNYIKIQEVTKLKQDLESQKMIRQAHEKLSGFGRPQQVSQAIEVYRKIAQKMNDKSSIGCNALGQIYEEGKFVETDRQKSQEYYRRSASLNDAQGLYKLGKYLQKGLIKLPQNQSNLKLKRQDQLRTAIEYYEKAAEMNHLDAITDLGYIYQKGIQNTSSTLKTSHASKSDNLSQQSDKTDTNSTYFIEPNLNYAIKYYTIAKKAQFPRAINNLGTLLIRQNHSIAQRVKGTNLQKGIKYLKTAAQLGYLKAYFNLGKCYENGLGVQKNYQNAKKYYQKGSQKGDLSCKIEFIKCFFTDGFPKNAQSDDSQIAKLIQLIRQVLILEPNNKQCLFYMGIFHQRGDGVIKNAQLAYNYVSKSASYDYLPAITKLGDYKYSGFSVAKDLEGAVRLYEKAAKGGDPQAMINLSLVLEKNLIKPIKGSSPDYIKYLQKQALKTKSSNAYLIAGLKEQNYRVNVRSTQDYNEKILKSVELGNRDAINLIEKTRRSENVERMVKFEPKTMINKTKNDPLRTDQTIPFENPLKRVRSAQNLKTTKT